MVMVSIDNDYNDVNDLWHLITSLDVEHLMESV